MKYGALFTMILGIILAAYFNAQSKLLSQTNLTSLHLNMTVEEIETALGSPDNRDRNTLTYILEDSSQLYITLREGIVASALLKFKNPLKISDPQLRKMTFVQMSPASIQDEKPSWFFAGKPEEGHIYKITQSGEVESMTWVPPFSYGNNQEKNLSVLLRDFKNQNTSNL